MNHRCEAALDFFDIQAEQFFGVLRGDSHSRFDAGGVSPPDGPYARGAKVGVELERLEAFDQFNWPPGLPSLVTLSKLARTRCANR